MAFTNTLTPTSTPTPIKHIVSNIIQASEADNSLFVYQNGNTPMTLPEYYRRKFIYTPGLFAFLDIVMNMSVITRTNPEELAKSFFDEYDIQIKKGEYYPALQAGQKLMKSLMS